MSPEVALIVPLAAACILGLFAIISNSSDVQKGLVLAITALVGAAAGGGIGTVAANESAEDAAADVQQQVEDQVDRAVQEGQP